MLVTNLSTIKCHVKFVKESFSVTEHCSMILVLMSLCIFSKLIVHGRLKWPADFKLEIVTQTFLVFRVMVSKDYEAKLLNLDNQKSALMLLVTERLKPLGAVDGAYTCGTTLLALAQEALSVITNICLNNYFKKIADTRNAGKQKVKRKLSTLKK